LKLQGFGRHSTSEQAELAIADINALATLVGEKAFLMGDRPCGADATVFAFVASFLSPVHYADPISGGKAPKSCWLPRPRPAALFSGVGAREVPLFGATKMFLDS
jgi:glutathione S-transferase